MGNPVAYAAGFCIAYLGTFYPVMGTIDLDYL
jgi:hypothetical protein